MLRALIYFWRRNLAVVAGAAVVSAVLSGALLVGDSVRGSLRELTLERLGGIDYALSSSRFLPDDLAARLAAMPGFASRFQDAAPVILLTGSAIHQGSSARAGEVGLYGIDARFLQLFERPPQNADRNAEALAAWNELAPHFVSTAPRTPLPPVVLNQALAHELGAAVGDGVVIALKRYSAIPRGSLLGRKDTDHVVMRIRCQVAGIVPDHGLGAFGLKAQQAVPRNAFVPLNALQRALNQPGTANGVVVAAAPPTAPEDAAADAAALDALLRAGLDAADFGIKVTPGADYLTVESDEFILKPTIVQAVEQIAEHHRAQVFPLLTYLVNRIASPRAEVPYATISALDTAPPPVFGALRLVDSTPAPQLASDEILLNAWTADELGVQVGEPVVLTYFVVGPEERLREEQATLRFRGALELTGLAGDRHLSQEYPGIADADNMAAWDPPFPLDLRRIRPRDEEYWDRYRGTPRGYLATATGQRLWRNPWGELTALRLAPTGGQSVPELAARLSADLPQQIPLTAFGLRFQPVKQQGLQAAVGATDFSGLFIGFSQFLIVAAALLMGLLFRLGVEQRAGEIGLRLALGFPLARVRRMLLGEGAWLAAGGALLGLDGAVLYAKMLILGLKTLWQGAIGTSRLNLYLEPGSLVLGLVLAFAIMLFAVWRTVRRIGQVPAVRLLARRVEVPATRAGRAAQWTLGLALLLAAVFAGAGFASGDPLLQFALGPCVLVALLAGMGRWFSRHAVGSLSGRLALLRMAAANCTRNRGRSLLAMTLVAVAAFMIVTVAAYREDFAVESLDKTAGTGGFALIASSEVELHQDLNSASGRFELGISERTEKLLAKSQVIAMKLLPGDDTSCLNLYRPQRPRLLGVPPALLERGGFTFQQTLNPDAATVANPWSLLERELAPGVLPVLGDANSTQWILKLALGDAWVLPDEHGNTIRLQLVGTLKTSLFQSELLIAEKHLLRHFPSRSGAAYFLVESPPESAEELAQALERDLAPYGLDVLTTAAKLASFHAVQNTYLSTFQALGGLGLLLGTVGLAVILARNALERQGELAALRAMGFTRKRLRQLIAAENGLLLLAGLGAGTLAAMAATASRLSHLPWGSLGMTLGGILLFGLLAGALTAHQVLRAPLLPALKAE